jgi:phosphohistidine phosphatase
VELYLVRHAIAERRDAARWPDDAQRPLTDSGREKFAAVGRGLRRLGVTVDSVLASPYVRAWQTAEILRDEAGWPAPTPCTELEPGPQPSATIDILGGRSESSLALVGHEPHLSSLAALVLTGSDDGVRIDLKKGGVICLSCTYPPAAGAGVLRWSAAPKLLRSLGG